MMMVRDMTRPILRAMRNGFRSCWRRRWRRASRSHGIEAMMIDPRTLEVAEYVYRASSLTSLLRPSAGVALVSAKSRMTPSFPRSLPLARSCRPASAITWLRRAIGAGSAASERSISQTSSARRTVAGQMAMGKPSSHSPAAPGSLWPRMGRVDQEQRRARSPQQRAPRQRQRRNHPLISPDHATEMRCCKRRARLRQPPSRIRCVGRDCRATYP
jgi:hypothetical protein